MRRPIRERLWICVLCGLCASLLPAVACGQSLKEQLVGTWTLLSWTRMVGGVEEPLSVGRDPIGQVMFGADGSLCFNVMRRERPPFTSAEFQAGTAEEKATAYDGYFGFCGRYDVDERDQAIAIRVNLASYPNWTGTTQKRFVQVTGTRLQLSTPPISSRGKPVSNTVVWERMK